MGKVLLTGGSGFVGSNTVLEFLRRGHEVVTTVRSQAKGDALRLAIPADLTSLLTCSIVEDISAPHAFDAVLSAHAFDAVIHTAASFQFQNYKDPQDLLSPAIDGTKSILESIKRLASPTLKRLVVTSSHAALVDMSKGNRPGYVYSAEDWNPIDWKTASEVNPVYNYLGAKTFGERMAWDFVKEYPTLEVVSICPPSIYGPILIRPESMSSLNMSNASLYAYINGSLKGAEIPQQFFHDWVDVRNVAQAHVLAYEKPEAANRRFVISAGNHTYKEIAVVIGRNFPDTIENLPTKLHEGLMPDGAPIGGCHTFDVGPSKTLLGIEYIPLEKSLVDTVSCLQAFERNN